MEQFVAQLRAVGSAGGSVAADPVILSLYQTLNALHPQLLKQVDDVQQQKGEKEGNRQYWALPVLLLGKKSVTFTFTNTNT